jgi:hypothetical protein
MAGYVIYVSCDDEIHRVELDPDGTGKMLDHDDSFVRAFTLFGADPPTCFALLEEWSTAPMETLTEILGDAAGGEDYEAAYKFLACDFAEHVLPLYAPYAAKAPKESAPPEALEAALDAARREIRGEKDPEEAPFKLYYGIIERYKEEKDARHRERLDREGEAYTQEGREHELMASQVLEAVFDALRCTLASGRKVWSRLMDTQMGGEAASDWAKKKEEPWQLEHGLKVVQALQEEKPWPSVS